MCICTTRVETISYIFENLLNLRRRKLFFFYQTEFILVSFMYIVILLNDTQAATLIVYININLNRTLILKLKKNVFAYDWPWIRFDLKRIQKKKTIVIWKITINWYSEPEWTGIIICIKTQKRALQLLAQKLY